MDIALAVGKVRDSYYGDRFVNKHGGILEKLVQQGRVGRATGKGWYVYPGESRKPVPDDQINSLYGNRVEQIAYDEAVKMMFYLVANEGALLMEEKMVYN